MKRLGVYLLSYKRPDYIQDAIASILAQDYVDFELIISENTPDDSVIEAIKSFSHDPRVRFIKRSPSLASLDHINLVLTEAQSYQYAMLFHDDDVLLSGALSKMVQVLDNDKALSAVASNAYVIKNTTATNNLLSPGINADIKISRASHFILRNLLRSLGTAPFPSYIYRTNFLKNIKLNSANGGKYSDSAFLTNLIQKGPFFWLCEPLLGYRQHGGNDSARLNISEIFHLCLFYLKTTPWLFPVIGFYFSKQLLKKLIRN